MKRMKDRKGSQEAGLLRSSSGAETMSLEISANWPSLDPSIGSSIFMSSCSFCLVAGLFLVAGGSLRAQDNPADAPFAEAQSTDPHAPAAPHAGRAVTLSDFGAEDLGYLCVPNTPPTVGVVLIPDAYGLDDFTKHEAERLAADGFIAVAVDIYNGKTTNDPGQIANMVENLDDASVMKTVTAGVRLFHESPKFRVDHVVMVGWGTGANYTWQAAHQTAGLDGAILFYGPMQTGTVKKCPIPVCAFYSDRDPAVTHAGVLDFQHALRDVGSDFTAWFIAAGPGWSNPQSKAYSPVEDKEAWKVAEPFLLRIGAEPVRPPDANPLDKVKDSVKNLIDKL
jgi:carboxymethylenebutenolidase